MYYFASDIHLGLKVGQTHATRERLFVRWLDEVSADAEAIFLVGDVSISGTSIGASCRKGSRGCWENCRN